MSVAQTCYQAVNLYTHGREVKAYREKPEMLHEQRLGKGAVEASRTGFVLLLHTYASCGT
jgi:hypothetical protein